MATIGTVTYPTDATWQVQVTGLATGTNTLTVSDGTDAVTVTAEGPVIISAADLSGTGSLGPVSWTTGQGLPLRDGTTRKWCPLRYTANGNPLWIRRV
jgi:hypothetical protein